MTGKAMQRVDYRSIAPGAPSLPAPARPGVLWGVCFEELQEVERTLARCGQLLERVPPVALAWFSATTVSLHARDMFANTSAVNGSFFVSMHIQYTSVRLRSKAMPTTTLITVCVKSMQFEGLYRQKLHWIVILSEKGDV